MKKIFVLVLTFLLVVTMTACGKGSKSNHEEALLDLGIEVTKTMQEMVYAEEYISIYASNAFADEIVQFQAADYDSPIAVYSVEGPSTKEILLKLGSGNIDAYDKLSDNLKEQLDHRASFTSVISSINAQKGTDVMALCSLLTATKYDRDVELDKSITYVYIFEEGVPIAVTFTESGYANGQFFMLGNNTSYEDISKVFNNYSCRVNKVK